MSTEKIHIAIVDDHTLFRNGIAELLKEYNDICIDFMAENGIDLQQQINRYPQTSVILMDINMPLMNGYETTAWVTRTHENVKVLALTMHEEDEAVIKMIRAGARGYILKQSKPAEVIEAIKAIDSKGIFINEMVSGKMYRTISTVDNNSQISGKEMEFIKLCCSEMTYKEIADVMFVSPRTVDNYRDALFQKLGLKSRTGLVLYAIKHKIFIV